MKTGTVALFGRPNVGKSTLINNLVGQKVAITSPKPQTTRFLIQAAYQDERGQIIFIDTPGIFNKAKDHLAKKINQKSRRVLAENIDLLIYLIDHSRKRDFEEAKVLGLIRQVKKPKILVINKIDIKKPTYLPQYEFLKEEFKDVIYISALYKKHLKSLFDCIFSLLPDKKEPLAKLDSRTTPILNIDSKTFIAELIREKVFLKMRKEVPYSTSVIVDEIINRNDNLIYIKARILTTEDKYKKMLIGQAGRKIKEIGSMTRKELETGTGKKVYLDLTIETDRHWINTLV